MDAKIKAAWITALRSGKFQQARGALRTPTNKFCCLGVLCELVHPDRWDNSGREWRHCDFGSMPSWEVLAAAGLDDDDSPETLANMNDEGRSFAEIADYIEKIIP
jgi:hypothetical protein